MKHGNEQMSGRDTRCQVYIERSRINATLTAYPDSTSTRSSTGPSNISGTMTTATPATGAKPAQALSLQSGVHAQNAQQAQQALLLRHALHSPSVSNECPIAVALLIQKIKTARENAMKEDFYSQVVESIAMQTDPEEAVMCRGLGEGNDVYRSGRRY
jgi:hypothetical protein